MLRIRNKPSIKVVEKVEFNWHSVYKQSVNTIFLRKGAEGTNIIHELIHANTDLSAGYDFSESFANYFAFLTCESLHKADRPASENNMRDFLRGIATIEKIRGLIGDELFGILITDFYAGLNEILKATAAEQLNELEVEILKFLVGWSYWGHVTLEFYEFTPKHIAKQLNAKTKKVTEAVEKLKKLGLLTDCDSTADSTVRERLYKLCEQLARTNNKTMTFFYR